MKIFKTKLENINQFKTIIDGMSRLVDELTIKIDGNGLYAQAMDRSHITYIGLEIKKDFFDEYEIDEPGEISINLDEVLNILGRHKKGDILRLNANEDILAPKFMGDGIRRFDLKQVEPKYIKTNRPSVDFSIIDLELPFDFFKNTIDDLSLVSNKFKLKINDTHIIFECNGTFSNIKSKFKHNNPGMGIINGNFYSLNFIKNFLYINKVSSIIKISTGEDLPLFLKLENDNVMVNFLIAPRLETR